MWAQEQHGKIKYTERYKDASGRRRTVSVTFPKDTAHNRKEAAEELRRRIAFLSDASEGCTLSEAIAKYEAYQEAHTRPSTYKRNKRVLKAVTDYLDDIGLNKLTAGYIRQKLPDDVPTLYNERITRLKAFLRWCYDNDLIQSVEWLAKLKPLETDYKEKLNCKYLEKEELLLLIDALQVERWKYVTEFLALTGLRIGEFIALLNSDVDTASRYIHINKTYMQIIGGVSPFPKTDNSVRDVYIQAELLPVIEKIREYRKECQRSKLFCPDPDGSFIAYDAYRKYLRTVSERVLDRKITPHVLRHTMTSLFAAERVPLSVIARRLGHSDSKLTERVYMHVTKNLRAADAEIIDDIKLL